MVTVTFLGRKTASSTSCFRRQWPLARTPVVEGQRVTVRYWIDARAHIFERQMLLMFVCLLYNPRKLKTNKKTQHHPDSFFGIGMLFRNFALEPMRLPKFLCLAVLHWGLKAFDVQSHLGKVVMSFTVAADRMCSSPGQILRFPGDGPSHSEFRGHHSGRVGGRGLWQKRDHCGCRYLLSSYSLC